MKAKLENIALEKGSSSFYAYKVQVPNFEFKWHYHQEYELTYIIKGSGYRLVGNSYEYFNEGDLVLLGSNLPHTWTSKKQKGLKSEAIVIQFSNEFISSFLSIHEGIPIRKMLEFAARGIRFENNETWHNQLLQITESRGMERILKLIRVLDDLSREPIHMISSNTFHIIVSKKNEMRINKVCLYIQDHFMGKISLKEVADLIHLTESNFCKFFKKATGKTYSDYINEMRINEAARLLLQTEKTINQISYECGFETLSYFNRVFLNKKRKTPSTFRKEKIY